MVMYIDFFTILLVLLLRFDITDHFVGMHSLQVIDYSSIVLSL